MKVIDLVETMKGRTPLIIKPLKAKKQRFCHLAREWYVNMDENETRGFARYREYDVVAISTEGNAILAEITKGEEDD